MLAIPLLPLDRPARARLRSVRRPFLPSGRGGPYRLPHDVRDHLVAALTPYRNREAALELAVFLGRFWSAPGRLITLSLGPPKPCPEHHGLPALLKWTRHLVHKL